VADPPSAALQDREQDEGYVAMVCFKHGPHEGIPVTLAALKRTAEAV